MVTVRKSEKVQIHKPPTQALGQMSCWCTDPVREPAARCVYEQPLLSNSRCWGLHAKWFGCDTHTLRLTPDPQSCQASLQAVAHGQVQPHTSTSETRFNWQLAPRPPTAWGEGWLQLQRA